ncbi:MAG: hypothetical protein ACREMF_06300, partial [Gemmatimonadales bacterium]
RLADERGGYALADLPTLATLPGLALRPLFTADSTLLNPYTLTVIRTTTPHPAARGFATWALGRWRDSILAIRLPDGSPAFGPSKGECQP